MINKTNTIPISTQVKPQSIKDDSKYIPEPYKNVARGMEKQFVEFMLEQMQKTAPSSQTDTASQYYQGLMKSERAENMVRHNGGLGIQEVILDQVYPKKFRNKFAYNQFLEMNRKNQKQTIEIKKNSPKVNIHE